ncbi:DUF6879 family protein [Nonomuraea phyllanthi]|uniref:DUF6879 family protein n=1 Tax=Nonomuraea phyllanthi TaxID=2219224 RepID=UPI001D14CC03|nr:DUF6879 family protein [Nonomuraea phyllanthi]
MTSEVSPDEFLDMFRQATSDVFRLELRDRYNVPAERDRWEAFQARDWPRLDELNAAQRVTWMQLMQEVAEAGRRVERVRVVTEPPSDYIRFELRLNAGNAEAGEDIRYLPRDQARGLDLPEVDYWLFDTVAVVLRFNEDDELLGMDLADDLATIESFRAGKAAAWRQAVPYQEYATKWADLAEPSSGT